MNKCCLLTAKNCAQGFAGLQVWGSVLRLCQTFLHWDLGLGLVPHPISEALGFGKSQRSEMGEVVKGSTRISVNPGLGK